MTVRRFFISFASAIALTGTLTAFAADNQQATPMLRNQPAPLVDLSGSTVSGGSATADQSAIDAPIVDTSNKKKKQPQSFWSKLMHPTQWFSSKK